MSNNQELRDQLALQREMNKLLEREAELRGNVTDRAKTQSDVQSDFFSMFNENSSTTSDATSGQQDLASALDDVANSQKEVGESTNYTEKAMLLLNKAAKSVSVGFQSLMRVMKPLYSLIMLNPVFDMLGNNLQNVRGAQQGAFEATQQFKEQLGTLPNTIKKFNDFVSEAGATVSETGRSLASFAGIEYGDITKKFLGYASSMGVGFDHFIEKAKGAAGEIVLFNEGLGMSIETLEDLTFRFGEDSFGDFAKQLVGGAEDLGLSLKSVSKNFQAGINDANNFGYMTRKELTATSLYATKLGMEMSELAAFGNKFDTFEGAADSVGKLSAAFGIQLDTMDLVMEDNPAKKLDMVREALEKSGKSIDSILGNRREAKYLADSLGLPIEQLEKLSSISSDEFGFTDALDSAADAQENMTEMDAMKQISKDIRDLNTALNPMQNQAKSFFGAFIQGFKTAAESGGVFKKLTDSFKSALDSFFAVGTKVYGLVSDLFALGDKGGAGRGPLAGMVEPFFKYFKQMEGVAAKLIGVPGYKGKDPKKRGILKNVFDEIGKFLNPKTQGDAFKDGNIFDMLFAPFKDVDRPSIMTPGIKKGLISLAKLLVSSLSQAFRFIGTQATSWVAKLFTFRRKTFDSGSDEGKALSDFASEMVTSLGDMLADLFEAASGLSAFLVGGTFQGVNYSYEDSLFGKMFAEAADSEDKFSSSFEDILGNIIGGIAGLFGDSDLAAAFQLGGVNLGMKFKYAFTLMKESALIAFAEMATDLSQFAKDEMQKFGDASINPFYNYDPRYLILETMAGGSDTIASALSAKATNAGDAAAFMRAEMEALNEEFINSFDSSGEFRESLPETGAEIASDLNAGLANGLMESFPTSEVEELGKQYETSIRDVLDTKSPSMMTYDIGVDMADGLITGFFGNDSLITGSEETGFINKFNKQMDEVSKMIESSYADISRSAVASIETKLGRVGEILSGEKPLTVVVDNQKVQIKLAVNVTMDSNDVASGIASASGGSYFYVNPLRDASADGYRALETDV